VGEVLIDKYIPWGYFDGACQGLDSIRSMGGILYISIITFGSKLIWVKAQTIILNLWH
jgi:hypothetical protein